MGTSGGGADQLMNERLLTIDWQQQTLPPVPDQAAGSHGRDHHRDLAASAGDAGATTADQGVCQRPAGELCVCRGSAGHGSGADAA